MIKIISRTLALLAIGYFFGLGIIHYSKGYNFAEKMHQEGNLNLLSACLEVTASNAIYGIGFKAYLKDNTDVMQELEKLHILY